MKPEHNNGGRSKSGLKHIKLLMNASELVVKMMNEPDEEDEGFIPLTEEEMKKGVLKSFAKSWKNDKKRY